MRSSVVGIVFVVVVVYFLFFVLICQMKVRRYTVQWVRIDMHLRAGKKKKTYVGSWLMPSCHSLQLSSPPSPPSVPKYSNC